MDKPIEAADATAPEQEMEPPLYVEPWSRLWARFFDTAVLALVVGLVAGLLLPEFLSNPAFAGPLGALLVGMLFLPVILVVDATIMATFGTTLGKLLVGIRAERLDGGRLGRLALRRNAHIYVFGCWLGVPLLNLFGYTRAYNRLTSEGATSWDAKLGSRVVERGNNGFRTAVVAILYLAINFSSQLYNFYAQYKQPEWDRESIVTALPELNRGLPHFFDDVTRLDRIGFTAEEGVLNYDYALIHKDASPIDSDELAEPAAIRAGLIRAYCGPDMAFYRERSIPARHRFHIGGTLRVDVRVTAADCRS